jgi:hypothetical protein
VLQVPADNPFPFFGIAALILADKDEKGSETVLVIGAVKQLHRLPKTEGMRIALGRFALVRNSDPQKTVPLSVAARVGAEEGGRLFSGAGIG